MGGVTLVTGVTGNVGGAVLRQLVAGGHSVRAAVRDATKARQALGGGLDLVDLDFTDASTFDKAFEGVDKLFLVRPPAIADTRRHLNPAVDAARAAGVEHIVFLSLMGIERNPIAPHYQVEKHLRASGISYTFLRPSFFMQNLAMPFNVKDIVQRGEILIPAGRGKTSFIDVQDIAAVAVRALTEVGHENRAYTLTGGEALDYYQVAAIFTAVLGKDVRYASPSVGRFRRRMREHGLTSDLINVMTAIYLVARLGLAKGVTSELESLLGRPPVTMRQFVVENVETWR